MVAEFKKYPILENDSLILPFLNSVLRDKAQHDLGIGTMHNMRSIIKDVFLPVWTCRAYTVKGEIEYMDFKIFILSPSQG